MTLLIVWGSIITYFTGVAIATRILHIRLYRAFVVWRNEKPDQAVRSGTGMYHYPDPRRPRQEVPFSAYMKWHATSPARWASFFWPFMGPYWAVNKICFPEVQVPDYVTIDELEKLK